MRRHHVASTLKRRHFVSCARWESKPIIINAYKSKSTQGGWLFWAIRPYETVFQSISSRLPERGRKKREMIDERNNVQTASHAPTASAVGPCPTLIQISRTPLYWNFAKHHRSTRPPLHKVVHYFLCLVNGPIYILWSLYR